MKQRDTAGLAGEGFIPSTRGAQPPRGVHKPEDLLAEGLLLLRADAGRGEAVLLHGLLDPDAQVAEAVLVQGKEDFCKVIHEAAGSLATDTLPQSTQTLSPWSHPPCRWALCLGSAVVLLGNRAQSCPSRSPPAPPAAALCRSHARLVPPGRSLRSEAAALSATQHLVYSVPEQAPRHRARAQPTALLLPSLCPAGCTMPPYSQKSHRML